MNDFIFLLIVAFFGTLFAIFQDLKYKEIANWVCFSLISFGLFFKLIYSFEESNLYFLWINFCGFILFVLAAYSFYYLKVFAGGDAKLLMGFGALIPFDSFENVLVITILFLFSLFLGGAIWSLAYSLKYSVGNYKRFILDFKKIFRRYKILFFVIALFLMFSVYNFNLFVSALFILFFFLIFVYTKSIDLQLYVLRKPNELVEGDWLVENIKVGNRVIKKTVDGLSAKDIDLLKKYKRSIIIKDGIPFSPAFMISLIMVFFYLISGLSFQEFLFFLF
jgi:Flp pilus assembly protein protease CpaA